LVRIGFEQIAIAWTAFVFSFKTEGGGTGCPRVNAATDLYLEPECCETTFVSRG